MRDKHRLENWHVRMNNDELIIIFLIHYKMKQDETVENVRFKNTLANQGL